jgi:hypothetical protein
VQWRIHPFFWSINLKKKEMKRIELIIAVVMLLCMIVSLGSMLFIATKSTELMYCALAFMLSALCSFLAIVANAAKSS